jgi:hypothetical protein
VKNLFAVTLGLLLAATASPAAGQWLNYPAPGIPRLPNGKPNLSAPAPRTLDGKPDLSGLWESERRLQEPLPGQFQPVVPIAIKPEDVVLTPEGEALQRQRTEDRFLGAQCLPLQFATRELLPFKILPLRGMVAILYEMNTSYRQIFTDGRELPKDPNPTWSGYSVGKWDGDTLVVDTTGFNDADLILPDRRPHSDALHIIERFWRRDFGHLEIQFTIDDPKVYAKPWSFKGDAHLIPDTELLEFICTENEKDLKHMVGGR